MAGILHLIYSGINSVEATDFFIFFIRVGLFCFFNETGRNKFYFKNVFLIFFFFFTKYVPSLKLPV